MGTDHRKQIGMRADRLTECLVVLPSGLLDRLGLVNLCLGDTVVGRHWLGIDWLLPSMRTCWMVSPVGDRPEPSG